MAYTYPGVNQVMRAVIHFTLITNQMKIIIFPLSATKQTVRTHARTQSASFVFRCVSLVLTPKRCFVFIRPHCCVPPGSAPILTTRVLSLPAITVSRRISLSSDRGQVLHSQPNADSKYLTAASKDGVNGISYRFAY